MSNDRSSSNHAQDPTEAEIQQAAYYIWLASGRLPGRDVENWLAAKEYLKHHHGRAKPTAVPDAEPASIHPLNVR